MIRQILIKTMLICVLTSTSAVAENHVTTVRWSELKEKGELKTGEVIPVTDNDQQNRNKEELLIVNNAATPLTVRLVTLEPTGVSTHLYRIHGHIRYEDVKQPGHLEMWNVFKNKNRYFTKTLSPSGPMGKIHGTSNSREFILPFQSTPETGPPIRLEINLVLPAEGKVWISPLELSEFTEAEWEAATTAKGAWWGNRTSAWIGAILGPLLGILGAMVGTLSGWGRGRNVCLGICWSMVIFGVISLVAGIVAVLLAQPYAVYMPLLLLGIVSTVVMGSVLPTTRKRFADIELRKIEAMDAGVV